MKKILLTLMLCVSVACGWAQVAKVSGSGASFKCTVEKLDSTYYIFGRLDSDYYFMNGPTLMFKTFDDFTFGRKLYASYLKAKKDSHTLITAYTYSRCTQRET